MTVYRTAVPANAEQALRAEEVISGWRIDDAMRWSLFPDAVSGPEEWGRVLAHAARHVTITIARQLDKNPDSILHTIVESFMQELTHQ